MLSASCCSGSVLAQSINTNTNDGDIEEIVIRATPFANNGTAQSLVVLSGDELAEKVQNSLGATVAKEPGVRSASFGAAVGRPVIHGLGAARVKVTEDRIDSLDVSVTSTDHAVSVEPFIANQITIIKGASSLLYGTGAIGGVVDIETGRISRELTGDPISGRVELRASDNGDGENGAFRLDGEAGGAFAWHVDGFSKKADAYDIPGFVESSQLRAAEAAAGGGDDGEEAARDVLDGSELDIQGGAIGASYIFDRGFVGVSVSKTEGQYGLLSGEEEEGDDDGGALVAVEEEEEEGTGFIDLEQTRYDIESELRFESSLVEKINFRLGINNYEHTEFEGDGGLGTVFENDAWEGRFEVTTKPVLGFDSVFGVQLSERDFSAVGEEAFVEPVDSDSQAVFWVGERNFDALDVEAGLRYEQNDYEPTGTDQNDNLFDDVDFSTVSASVGGVYRLSNEVTLSGLLDYAERAPTIEELFSNGPHLATQTFEIGDTNLNEESAIGLTFTGQYKISNFSLTATLYLTEFDDFIFQADTGNEQDGLRELVYEQDDATFAGIDFKAELGLGRIGQGDLGMSLLFDIVQAELDVTGNDNLPRIPANRLGLGFNWASDNWSASVDYVRVTEQNDVPDFEFETDAYNDVSVRVSRAIAFGENELNLFIQGRNITDDEQRNSVSFVKDIAPAPGRTFDIGARLSF